MSQYPPPGSLKPQPVTMTPPTLTYETPVATALNLKQVATQQRVINLCILAEIFLVFGSLIAGDLGGYAIFLLVLLYVGVLVIGAVFVFMLSLALYKTAWSILMGLMALVPLLGLIILLVMNARATIVLRKHGIRIGLLGADPSSIPIDGGIAQSGHRR